VLQAKSKKKLVFVQLVDHLGVYVKHKVLQNKRGSQMMVRSCWKPIVDGDEGDGSGRVDGLLWYKDLGSHLYGEFSMAVVQANSSLEDRGELESGPLSSNPLGPQGTFIGVYDGHGGSEASQFVIDNLFCNLKSML